MRIYDKLIKPIQEVNYLRAENVERYRVIIRYFLQEHENIHYWLQKDEIYEMMKTCSIFEDYTIEKCQSDLDALVNWGNLTAQQVSTKVYSLDDFKNKKFRYQISTYTIEIERMAKKLETLEIEGASLEPTLLERIQQQIMKVHEIIALDDAAIASWWRSLNNDFIRLNHDYQDYVKTLNSAKAEEMMKTKEFLVFKDKIATYLRTFVKSLQTHGILIEDTMKKITNIQLEHIVQSVVAYEMSIPRIDVQLQEDELYENCKGRWGSLYAWFVGENDQNEINRLYDITNEIIRKMTRYAQQIGELHSLGANRKEEYRHISSMFSMCHTLEEAHKVSAMIFGSDTCMHMKGNIPRDSDDINSGVYAETCAYMDLTPRTIMKKAKSSRKPANDFQIEKQMLRLQMEQEQEEHKKIIASYINNGVLDFSKLTGVTPKVRKILLSWLSRALSNAQRTGKTEDGKSYRIELEKDKEQCCLHCKDGDFYMPSYCIVFEEEVL